MWLKLLKTNNVKQLFEPRLVNGRWRGAAVGARRKTELRKYFEQAGVPWIYDKPTEEVHFKSPYNRKPKGTKWEN